MKRLLIVEDEANERFTLARLLELAGYEVSALPDASGALARLQEGDWHALITDVMMPGLDGLSLAREVSQQLPALPIVLTSAFHLCTNQLDRLGIAQLYFLDKPLDLDQLLAFLDCPEGHATGRRSHPPALPLPCLQRPEADAPHSRRPYAPVPA